MKLNFDPAGNFPILITFKTTRRFIGILGMSLPVVAVFWTLVISDCSSLLGSISMYYHTDIRDIFVGILCAVSFFFFTYHGYDYLDFFTFKIAGLLASGIALFPTTFKMHTPYCVNEPASQCSASGVIHIICAGLFFCTLAFISIVLFTKHRQDIRKEDLPAKKRQRNVVYRVCGILIIACLVLYAIVKLLPDDSAIHRINPIFWLETIALFSFAISWLIKGEFYFLKDEY